ncbi:HNH endonuclease signature motif containing protein [Corynebacterium auris]|uniref:HNH endonuclease signature motif containing protein n=1 Tax=Corynebacterium auris TaxID=44750 RepID=UPI0025B4A64F|nr:HNH endonuclease signature motif containing protein [Corynebacterium auris]WJY67235.1 hypothetical protein CAURIS_01520 [Corynebacterium auris]
MDSFTEFLGRARGGVDVLEHFDAHVALDAGVDAATVRAWKTVHAAYFGPTRYRKQQRSAREQARKRRASLAKLVLIERLIRHIDAADQRWKLRRRLLNLSGRCETLRRHAKSIVPARQRPPRPAGLWCAPTSREGMREIRITAPERFVAGLDYALRSRIDRARPAAKQMLDAFTTLVRGGGGAPEGAYRPIVAVPVSALYSVRRGVTGSDIRLIATDGTSVSLAELLKHDFGEELEVAAFHPAEGPLALFRAHRHANAHQRDLLKMAQPECSWVACHRPAESCDMHHITAWSKGGTTNVENLAPLCSFHNSVNDDDPARRRWGRIENVAGRPTWISPRGYAVANTTAHSAMQMLFGDPPDPPAPVPRP